MCNCCTVAKNYYCVTLKHELVAGFLLSEVVYTIKKMRQRKRKRHYSLNTGYYGEIMEFIASLKLLNLN